MSVLLIAEHNNKELKPFTLNAATAASQIDNDVHAVIIGHKCEEAAKALNCDVGAIVKSLILRKNDLLLLDSGCEYKWGTIVLFRSVCFSYF